MRAPSRLKAEINQHPPATSASQFHRATKRKQLPNTSRLSSTYLKHFPLLILSLGWYAGAIFILRNIHPTTIQHVPFTNAYGPLQFTLFAGHFFLFSFLLLNSRRGFLASLALSTLLFLKLQQVELNLILVSSVILTLSFTEFALQWVTKRLSS